MSKASAKSAPRFGPINPFALGGAFLQRARELGWVEEEHDGKRRHYYITKVGQAEMKAWGLKLDTVRAFPMEVPAPEKVAATAKARR